MKKASPKRADYLRFQTPPDKDLAIAGPVQPELYAATDGPDTDFMAKLVDVYPDGYEALLLDAPIRASYRNGGMPDDVKMMTPNAPEKLEIDLQPTAATFMKGHRIGVQITSSNSPRFEVNPNSGEPAGSRKLKPRVEANSVYMGATHPSAIVLPVVYPDDLKSKCGCASTGRELVPRLARISQPLAWSYKSLSYRPFEDLRRESSRFSGRIKIASGPTENVQKE